jgi:hypothetical protein
MDRILRLCELKASRNFQWIRAGRRRCQINPPAAAFRSGSASPGQGLLADARVGTKSALGGALSRALSRKAGAKCGPFSVVPDERRLCPSQHQRTPGASGPFSASPLQRAFESGLLSVGMPAF